ncbi:M56 family metallopeptidase [Segetibacter koreensis]|uniref:M56 family metallopeptidase n=1 Tax=Segetibacter koreensis TaxID=398037 RepID=UPI0003733BD1|nr:M56 family metallopeptidase [Segetibacter koreensis]
MLQLTQSPFLQALGYTIINSLWQFAGLWLIYVSIHTLLKLSSQKKYLAGLLIQSVGFIGFTATFTFYLRRFIQLQEIYFLEQKKISFALTVNNGLTIREKFFAGIIHGERLLPYLSVAYLLILLLLCLKWVRVYNITISLKTRGIQKIEANWRLFVKQLSTQLGIKHEVKIYLSELVHTPLTIGFLKPVILIPIASLNHLTTHQLEAVILHELAHIKRFDYLFNLFLALIEITLFFNPFMHLINRHLKRERENCCDDWVLQYQYNPASYANALLQIATFQSSPLLALKAADNKKVLLNRIIRMIEKKDKTFFNYRYQLMALLVMLTVLGSLAILSANHHINASTVSTSPRQVIAKPMMEIVHNPLYNPDFFIAPFSEKILVSKKQATEKVSKNNISDNLFPLVSRGTKLNNNRKNLRRQVPAEANRASLNDPEFPAAENVEKNIEVLNPVLDEVKFNVAAEKDQEVALAEEQLKELAQHVFEENKTLLDQKRVIAEIKAAFDQLKNIKIQLINSKTEITLGEHAKRNAAKVNQARIRSEFAFGTMNKLEHLAKELQLRAEKAEKQRNREAERNPRFYYNNNLKMPAVIYNLPFIEEPHSFSFELSTEPKAAPGTLFFKPKGGKKIDKTPVEDNSSLKLKSAKPFNLNEREQRLFEEEANHFVIIRI